MQNCQYRVRWSKRKSLCSPKNSRRNGSQRRPVLPKKRSGKREGYRSSSRQRNDASNESKLPNVEDRWQTAEGLNVVMERRLQPAGAAGGAAVAHTTAAFAAVLRAYLNPTKQQAVTVRAHPSRKRREAITVEEPAVAMGRSLRRAGAVEAVVVARTTVAFAGCG